MSEDLDKWERRQQLTEELQRKQIEDIESVLRSRKRVDELNESYDERHRRDVASAITTREAQSIHMDRMEALAKRNVEAQERIAAALEGLEKKA